MPRDVNFKKIEELIQLDYDAIQAYNQAIEKIDSPAICEVLENYRDDHERHVNDLSNALTAHGVNPPERKKDFKGHLIEGMTALQSAMGTKAALMAMKTNEKLTNRTYEKALEEDLPMDLRSIVEAGFRDERRHLRFIENVLDRKLWEEPDRVQEAAADAQSSAQMGAF